MPIQRIWDIYSNRNGKLPSKIIQNSFSMKVPSRRACHLNPLTTKESHISNVFINQILAMALLKVNSSSCRRYRNLFFEFSGKQLLQTSKQFNSNRLYKKWYSKTFGTWTRRKTSSAKYSLVLSMNNFILLKYCWRIMWHNLCHCSLFFNFISRWGQYGFNLDWFHSHIENDCWKWIRWTINFGRNNQGNNHSRCWTYSWNEGFHSRNHMIYMSIWHGS